MGRARQMERIIAKGQLVPVTFALEGVTAAQSDAPVPVAGSVAESVMPWDYEIVATTVAMSKARTAGTLGVAVLINGSATALAGEIGATSSQRSRVTSQRGRIVGVAGDRISVEMTTDSGFLPVTDNDLTVTVWALVHLDGI